MAKRFKADYTADDILGLYRQKTSEGDEARLRRLSTEFRALCRLEHEVTIPKQYQAISKQVRTPYIRDTWHRVSASLVAKPPVVHITPKDDQRKDYREAANTGERFDTALIERMNKELGEDLIYNDTAALVRDGESVVKVVHKPDAWATFPQRGDKPAADYNDEADRYKRGAELPLAWRNVDRLSMLFEDGEFGDGWALEYGEYPTPYLKRRYGMREVDGQLVDPRDTLGGKPKPEGWLQSSGPGRTVKVEFFDDREWHCLVDGTEPPGWPKANPYAPHIPYFRAKAYESESLLYSLLWLVPRLDELLTMKLNWSVLGAYPNPMLETVPNSATLPGLDGPLGNPGDAGEAKPLTWQPGKLMLLPIGQRLSFLVPPPVGKDINDLIIIFRGLIDVAGIPSIFRGSAGGADSGYMANQMYAAAGMAYKLASLTLQRQHESALEFVHWLVPSVIKQTVFVYGWNDVNPRTGKPKIKAGQAWLGLSPDSSGKNIAQVDKLGPVSLQFRPTLPTDEQARAMIAAQLVNSPIPLSGQRHALETYLQEEDPDSILDEIYVEQALREEPLKSKVVEEALREAGLTTETKPNPALSLVDVQGNPLIPPGPGQLNAVPAVPGQASAGLPSVAGVNMPMQPTPPQGVPGALGGRPAGMFPGMPANQGG